MALRIVTDSTCDLPGATLNELGIVVVPCNVHWGSEVLRDGIDITPDKFFRRLAASTESPTTSQPSIGTFVETYKTTGIRGDEILSIHVSSKLSGTYNAALQAKAQLPNAPLEVFDSIQASIGLGLQVREAAKIAQSGANLQETLAMLRREQPTFNTYVTVNTLKYLIRGGRASRLQGFLAGMLDVKPIIRVIDGETHPVDRVRTRKRAMARFTEVVRETKGIRGLGIVYSDSRTEAESLAQSFVPYYPREQIFLSQFSSVMGAHLGPGAMGVGIWSTPAQ